MRSRTQSKLKLGLTTQTISTLEKRTIISITTTANTEIGTTTTTTPVPISLHVINHVVLYMIKKAVNHGTTPKKNEKSLKLSLGLPTETSLANLITDSINNSINTL
jgi:hypothetical protein